MKTKKLILLFVFVSMSIITIAMVNLAPPSAKSIHNGNKQTIFSNVYIQGEYNKNSCIVELTFKQDIDNVEVIIYKGDSVCEYDQEQNIKKEDFYNYLLAQYGAGQYTICVKVDGITVVEKTVTCK